MFTSYVVYRGTWDPVGKSRPLEQVQLANQLQGFRIPYRWEAVEENLAILHHSSTQIEITISDGKHNLHGLLTRAHFPVHKNAVMYIEKRYHLFYNPCCKLGQHVTLIKTPVHIAQHVARSCNIIGNTRNNTPLVAYFYFNSPSLLTIFTRPCGFWSRHPIASVIEGPHFNSVFSCFL